MAELGYKPGDLAAGSVLIQAMLPLSVEQPHRQSQIIFPGHTGPPARSRGLTSYLHTVWPPSLSIPLVLLPLRHTLQTGFLSPAQEPSMTPSCQMLYMAMKALLHPDSFSQVDWCPVLITLHM